VGILAPFHLRRAVCTRFGQSWQVTRRCSVARIPIAPKQNPTKPPLDHGRRSHFEFGLRNIVEWPGKGCNRLGQGCEHRTDGLGYARTDHPDARADQHGTVSPPCLVACLGDVARAERYHCTQGYRDPVRAFEFGSKWYVGVGCGNKEEGAQFCLFEAADDTLANFTDRGSLYTTNITFGEVDSNIVWQPTNVSANMMECPDFFPLGDKWVLIGSLYKTNQWWVGTLSPSGPNGAPRFSPESVGILDFGNGYAAKTGTSWVQTNETQRLVFGFTGWQEPTMPSGCGRALIMPRELTVEGSELKIAPILETKVLRKSATRLFGHGVGAPIASGSRVEVRLNCTMSEWAHGKVGKVGVRTLATTDGSSFVEIGYDFGVQAMYADHSKCCEVPNTIIQRAPISATALGNTLSLAVFVDGGLIEAFLGGRAITPLVAPDAAAASPEARVTTMTNSAGITCSVESWQLSY
jgi:sucrose-6-phosphate hydrolase SacC (GH32 family)